MEEIKEDLNNKVSYNGSNANTRPDIATLRQMLDDLLEQESKYEITICHIEAIIREGVITDMALLEGMKKQIELLRPQLQEVQRRIQEYEASLGILDSATANFDNITL